MDFTGKPLSFLGYVYCELQVGEQYSKNARVLVRRKGTRSMIGSKLLSTLRYNFESVIEDELDANSIEKNNELCVET